MTAEEMAKALARSLYTEGDDGVYPTAPEWIASQLAAYGAKVAAETLEQAAKECESGNCPLSTRHCHNLDAQRIRALAVRRTAAVGGETGEV